MKRYAAYDQNCRFIMRVFADRPRNALAKAKDTHFAWIAPTRAYSMPRKVRCVAEDPMAQVTRGD